MNIGILASVGNHLDCFFPNIASDLEARGHAVSFAAGTHAHKVDALALRCMTRRPTVRNLAAPRELRQWVAREHLDVVLVNTATAGFLARVRDVGCPVVYFAHGLHWNSTDTLGAKVWQALERTALRRTAAVLVLNDEDEAWFREKAPELPVTRLEFGVGLPDGEFDRAKGPGSPNVVVWIGEHTPRKRPLLALEVAAESSRRGLPLKFRFLGDGVLTTQLHHAVEQSGLGEVVEVPGFLPVEPELVKAGILLHTARWEGLPRVVLEALGVGRSVVGFDVKGVRGIRGVEVVSDGDVNGMVDALERIASGQSVSPDPPPRSALSSTHAVTEIEALLQQAIAR